jgi:TRAP-type C4-dicarboxylate transport system permease small subunit
LIGLFDRCLETFACGLLVVLLVDVLLGVITRAFGEPLIWTDEGARFLMVWLASFGWMVAGRKRAHVRIRYFQGLLSPGLHRATERIIQLALFVFGGAVAWFGLSLVRRNLELEATSLPLSMAWLYVPLIPAGLVMALQAVSQAVERSRSPIGESLIE